MNPGLGGFQWSGSYSSWGGELRVKTVPSQYTQLGLYAAFPNQTNKHNNGLDFDGTPYIPGSFICG